MLAVGAEGAMAQDRVDYITIRGFRSIASVELLELRSLNVLIGANGSGKSNFLGVFSFLREVREGRLQDYVAKQGGADRLLHFGTKHTPQLQLHVWVAELANAYGITLSATADDRLYPADESVWFWDRHRYPTPYQEQLVPRAGWEAGISDPASTKIAGWIRQRLGLWVAYHFHDTKQLRQEVRS